MSHRAALWMWRLTDLRPTPEITVPYRQSPRPPGVVLHRSTDLRQEHGLERRGVWVTRPARTLVDIGAVLPPRQVEAAVDQALVRNLVTVPGLRSALDALGGRGRRGAGVLRTVLDQRALGDQRPESVLEPLIALALLRDHDVGPGPVPAGADHRDPGRRPSAADLNAPRSPSGHPFFEGFRGAGPQNRSKDRGTPPGPSHGLRRGTRRAAAPRPRDGRTCLMRRGGERESAGGAGRLDPSWLRTLDGRRPARRVRPIPAARPPRRHPDAGPLPGQPARVRVPRARLRPRPPRTGPPTDRRVAPTACSPSRCRSDAVPAAGGSAWPSRSVPCSRCCCSSWPWPWGTPTGATTRSTASTWACRRPRPERPRTT